MRILAVADEASPALWDYYDSRITKGVDLILSCGDLSPDYLEFLVTVVNKPLLYVRGNHDGRYDVRPPEGCVDIDDRIYDFHGLRILGLGGSARYRSGGDMYTEREMAARIRKLRGGILLRNGFDVLVTHAPARGYGDMDDLPHRGFECFNSLLDRYRPKLMFYGHVHKSYGSGFEKEMTHACGTRLVNAGGYRLIDIGEEEFPDEGKTGSALYDLYVSLRNRR
ncbi:MAG: metallophosphoesterase family protein [Bilifractor sp.]